MTEQTKEYGEAIYDSYEYDSNGEYTIDIKYAKGRYKKWE